MEDESGAEFRWTENTLGLSVTFVQHVESDLIIERLRLRPLGAEPMTLSDCYELLDDDIADASLCQLAAVGGGHLLTSPDGIVGSDPAELARLSENGGRAVNVFWNINAVMSFGFAVDGQVLRYFDPNGVDPSYGKQLTEEEGLLPEAEDSPETRALTLFRRLTGVSVSDDLLYCQSAPSYLAPYREALVGDYLPAMTEAPNRLDESVHYWVTIPVDVTPAEAHEYEDLVTGLGGLSWPAAAILDNPGDEFGTGLPQIQAAESFEAHIRSQGRFAVSEKNDCWPPRQS